MVHTTNLDKLAVFCLKVQPLMGDQFSLPVRLNPPSAGATLCGYQLIFTSFLLKYNKKVKEQLAFLLGGKRNSTSCSAAGRGDNETSNTEVAQKSLARIFSPYIVIFKKKKKQQLTCRDVNQLNLLRKAC